MYNKPSSFALPLWCPRAPHPCSSSGMLTRFANEVTPVIDSNITKELKRFWELESLGITKEPNVIDSLARPQDTKFDWTLGRYIVDLLWRSGYWPQSNGFSRCLAWLKRLQARLQEDSHLLKEYDDIFKK